MNPLRRSCARAVCFITTLILATTLFASSATAASVSWSGPIQVDPEASGIALDRVACPSTTQCTAVDGQGQAVTFNPQAPKGATTITISNQTLSGVACPSTTQCTAVDINGQEITFDPQSSAGGTPTAVDSGNVPLALACPSDSLCTTVDDSGRAVTFNPQSSQKIAAAAVDPGQVLVGVDCPGNSVTKCAAVDSSGGAVLFNPQSPVSQAPTVVDPTTGASPTALSCRATECVVVDNVGTGATFDTSGSQPSERGSGPIDQTSSGANAVSGVSCPSDSQCVGVDVHGGEATFSPTLPISAAVPVDPGQTLAGIACPDVNECVAVDRDGQEVTFNPASPADATRAPIDGHTTLSSLSCPATGQCTAVDVGGTEVTFVPGSSAAPGTARIDSGANGVFGVACPRTDECAAVDSSGQEVTFDPQSAGSPSSQAVDKGHALFAVACSASVQCTAVDDAGREVTFNPYAPGGANPAAVDSGHGLLAIACPSMTQCTAVDDSGAEVTFNPQAPGRPVPRAMDRVPDTALACPNTTQCTAVDASGDEVTFNPQAPSLASAENVDGSSQLTGIACRTVTACVAVDQTGRSVEGDPRGTGAWSGRQVTGSSLAGVSCPVAVTCVAIDTPGEAFLGSGGPLPPVPGRISSPSISGRAQQGRLLSVRHGRWTNAPTSYGYQWIRCNARGLRCSVIRGATGGSYRPTRVDIGHRLRVRETAWNITGPGAAATSRTSAIVRPAVAIALHGVSLSGLASGHPRFAFTAVHGIGDPPVKRISLTLPAGFAVTGAIQRLSAAGGGRHAVGFTSVGRGRTLTITLRKPATSLSVVLGGRGISETARTRQQFRSHRRLYLVVTFGAVLRGGTRARVTLSPRTS